MSDELYIRITIKERDGINRVKEPVSIGIPFSKGILYNTDLIYVVDNKENRIPIQTEVLTRWHDKKNSIK